MHLLILLLFFGITSSLTAQDQVKGPEPRPSYCADATDTFGNTDATAAPLPKFATTPTTEYRVQVAILRYTDPAEYPFHSTLVARWRPCEQVWVIESRQSFTERDQAVTLQGTLAEAGYTGTYITELIAYQ